MKPIHLLLLSLLLASCGKKESTANSQPVASVNPSGIVEAVLSSTPSGEAQDIHVVRSSVKPGDEVTLAGRIMGNKAPFVEGRAVFTLADPKILTACNDIPGDSCKTPWDNCCDSKEDKLLGLATIQILGEDSRALHENLEGVGGLQKLSTIIVSGKVAEGSNKDSLVINATAIQVKK